LEPLVSHDETAFNKEIAHAMWESEDKRCDRINLSAHKPQTVNTKQGDISALPDFK
jgi:hypothetical protein